MGVLGSLNLVATSTIIVILILNLVAGACNCTTTSSYVRPPPRKSLFISEDQDSDDAPQQVHISLAGENKMRISWITENSTPTVVQYGTSSGVYEFSANGTSSSYKYLLYKSGQIHNVVISQLLPNTVYFYRCGQDSTLKEFTFKTPPDQFPINFAISGDLGQTEWTKSTLDHISNSNYDVFLLPGDLSYADIVQSLWDSFGRLVEPLASNRPWMVTQGNHEVEKIPIVHNQAFTSYNTRWQMPFQESGSSSNLYYSFDVAGVHIIMLGSYTDFEAGSEQHTWLQSDLARIDRKKTPWLMALIHAPWYNSNNAHQGEKESTEMKDAMEELLYNARVDIVFSGHVHAYERFTRVYKDGADECGPVHITIGDGGNREGLAESYMDPQPKISVFREASFGHGRLQVVNGSYAFWEWHRNDDNESVVSDSVWLMSSASNPACT